MTVYPPEGALLVAAAAAILGVHAFLLGQRLAQLLIRWAARRWPRA